MHLLSVDTEGHDALVLEGLRGSLARGVIDVLEFEFNSQLGSWNARSSQRRTLRSTLEMLEFFSYSCFWQDSSGCLSPASGACFRDGFERVGWSNLVCARGARPEGRSRGQGRGRTKAHSEAEAAARRVSAARNPLSLLWEVSEECRERAS